MQVAWPRIVQKDDAAVSKQCQRICEIAGRLLVAMVAIDEDDMRRATVIDVKKLI
jgi:hypothetical protein